MSEEERKNEDNFYGGCSKLPPKLHAKGAAPPSVNTVIRSTKIVEVINRVGNVWKFYTYGGLVGFGKGVIIPIVVLFFLDRGITLAQFTVLWSMLNLSTVIFEMPTGIMADRFSRKWSVCLGILFEVIAILTILATKDYLLLAFGFLSWGVGQAFGSGANSALLYDSLKADGLEDKFHKTVGNATSLALVSGVLAAALSGVVIRTGGFIWVWWIAGVCHLLAGIMASLFREPPFLQEFRSGQKGGSFGGQVVSYVNHLKESFRFVGGNWGLMALIFINIVSPRFFVLVDRPFAQPYLFSFGYSPEQISYFYTIFFIITAIFARYSHKVVEIVSRSERSSLLVIGLLGMVSLSIMVNARIGLVVIGSLIGINIMKGLFGPFIEDSLNRRVTSEKRATCLSIAMMGNNFLGVFLGPIFGYVADAFSLKSSLLIFQWTFGPMLLIGVIWGWKALGRIPRSDVSGIISN